MKFTKALIITLIVVGSLFVLATPFIIINRNKTQVSIPEVKVEPAMLWGATVRPFAIDDTGGTIEEQYNYLQDLFGDDFVVRANVEKNNSINDLLVDTKDDYNARLYFVLEEDINFNDTSTDFEARANEFAQRIVSRYIGRVEYYQLMNEVSGVMVTQPDDTGEQLDAGYGLTVDKTRYDNVLTYTKALSQQVRDLDPNAKILISGHWILIDPVLSLINDGLDVDIVGWNWNSTMSDKPGIMEVDGYGIVNIPEKVTNAGKIFWIAEGYRADGSTDGKEAEQAEYVGELARSSRDNEEVRAFLHFTLTDLDEDGPDRNYGLVSIKETSANNWIFGPVKPVYNVLKQIASGD